MKKYKLKSIFLIGVLSNLLLLSGCGSLPTADKIVIPALEARNPKATFNTGTQARKPANLAKNTTNRSRQLKPTPDKARKSQIAKPSITRANQLMRSGRKAAAADMYYRSAFRYRPPQRERIILQAAEISISGGDKKQAARYLQTAARSPLNALNKVRYRYVKALLALHNKQATQALRLLPPTPDTIGLPVGLRDKIALVRQHALNQQRAAAIPKPTATTYAPKPAPAPKRNTGRKLTTTTPTVNYQAAQNPILNTARPNAAVLQQPAAQNTQTPALAPMLPRSTNRIAVLLPASGGLARVGNEIYQGMQDAQAINGNKVILKRYPTHKNNVINQYQQAVADGADIVIGPLHKDALATLTAQAQLLQTPVLSLNYLPGGDNLPHTLYQFGLSPDDEVRQIAQLALQRGQMNAVIMVPDSPWGSRLSNAFAQAYQQGGGHVLHAETYSAAKPSTYLTHVQSLPGQNEGANMVFLAASPTQARLLHPLLKAQAGLMPVYATSHVYSGRAASEKDIDLDGIIYTEIPYILQKNVKGSLDKLKYPRLYALGMDSLMVARNLAPLVQQTTLGGRTGQISMNPQRRLQRRLEFATFINGQVHNLHQ